MKLNSILIVIVLYETNIEKSISYNSLKVQHKDFYLFDNKPPLDCPKRTLPDNVIYVKSPVNFGLSYAYNQGASYAKKHGFDWLLIADQDTFFPTDTIKQYNEAINQYPDIKLFLPKVRIASDGKFMSPINKHFFFTKLSKCVPSGTIHPSKYGIINSGLLINVDAFWKVGGYNEKVWLDFSDYQFIERFSRKFNSARIVNVECIQSFSNEVSDTSQKIARFKMFCNSIKHFETNKLIDRISILGVVLKRTLSLIVQGRTFKPIQILIQEYFK